MKFKLLIVLLLFCSKFTSYSQLPGDIRQLDTLDKSVPYREYGTGISPKLFLNNIQLRTKGETIPGNFINFRNDSVIYLRSGKLNQLSFGEIERLSMEGNMNRGQRTALGFLLGFYSGSVIFPAARDNGSPCYLGEDAWASLVIGSAVSLVFGFISNRIHSPNYIEIDDFKCKNDADTLTWTDFENYLRGLHRTRGFRISFEAGHVYHGMDDAYAGNGWQKYESSDLSSINLLRKVQADLNVTDRLSIGLSFINLNKPKYRRTDFYYYADLSGQGYYLNLIYSPFIGLIPNNWELNLCLGAGFSNHHFYVNDGITDHRYSSFGILYYTELVARLNKYLGLGLIFEQVIPFESPDSPELVQSNLVPKKLPLGSSCIGISIKWYFTKY